MSSTGTDLLLVELTEDREISLDGIGFPEHRRYRATTHMDGMVVLRPESGEVPPRDLTVTVHEFQRNWDVMFDRVGAGGFIHLTDDSGTVQHVVMPLGRWEALKALGVEHGIEF